MSDVRISQGLMTKLFTANVLNKDIENIEHVANILCSMDGDKLAFALDLALSDNIFTVKKPEQLVKFKPYKYDDGDLYDMDQMKDMGLFKNGYMFGRISGRNESNGSELHRPYAEKLWVDQLICTHAEQGILTVEFTGMDKPRLIANQEIFPVNKSQIPYYGKNKS